MIVIGPHLLTGIGQHAKKYTSVFENASYHVIGSELPVSDYGLIMKEFKRVAVPRQFCKRVLSRQFPDNEFYVIHAHIPNPPDKPYTFYHIGNILDQRKNFRNILEAFVRLNKPDARL